MIATFRRPPAPVEPGGAYRVLLVCSSGGHTHVRSSDDVRSTLVGEDVVEGHHPTTRNLPNLLRNVALAVRTIRRVRPDVVVSDGAGLAVPFFWAARAAGVRTAYLEVYDRVDGPTLTTRLVRPVCDLLMVQWPDQQTALPGSVLAGPVF